MTVALIAVAAALAVAVLCGCGLWWAFRPTVRVGPGHRMPRHLRAAASPGDETATGVIRRIDPSMLPRPRRAQKAAYAQMQAVAARAEAEDQR